MLGKQAKILSALDVSDLLAFVDCSRQPLRNRVLVLLSTKAGLRAGEIAGLTWDMVARRQRADQFCHRAARWRSKERWRSLNPDPPCPCQRPRRVARAFERGGVCGAV